MGITSTIINELNKVLQTAVRQAEPTSFRNTVPASAMFMDQPVTVYERLGIENRDGKIRKKFEVVCMDFDRLGSSVNFEFLEDDASIAAATYAAYVNSPEHYAILKERMIAGRKLHKQNLEQHIVAITSTINSLTTLSSTEKSILIELFNEHVDRAEAIGVNTAIENDTILIEFIKQFGTYLVPPVSNTDAETAKKIIKSYNNCVFEKLARIMNACQPDKKFNNGWYFSDKSASFIFNNTQNDDKCPSHILIAFKFLRDVYAAYQRHIFVGIVTFLTGYYEKLFGYSYHVCYNNYVTRRERIRNQNQRNKTDMTKPLFNPKQRMTFVIDATNNNETNSDTIDSDINSKDSVPEDIPFVTSVNKPEKNYETSTSFGGNPFKGLNIDEFGEITDANAITEKPKRKSKKKERNNEFEGSSKIEKPYSRKNYRLEEE